MQSKIQDLTDDEWHPISWCMRMSSHSFILSIQMVYHVVLVWMIDGWWWWWSSYFGHVKWRNRIRTNKLTHRTAQQKKESATLQTCTDCVASCRGKAGGVRSPPWPLFKLPRAEPIAGGRAATDRCRWRGRGRGHKRLFSSFFSFSFFPFSMKISKEAAACQLMLCSQHTRNNLWSTTVRPPIIRLECLTARPPAHSQLERKEQKAAKAKVTSRRRRRRRLPASIWCLYRRKQHNDDTKHID